MLRTVIFDDQIKLWWDYEKTTKEECFVIYTNNEKLGKTKASNYSVKNLIGDTEYQFSVFIETCDGKKVKEVGSVKVKTLAEKEKIDVTKPPYNAVGDGQTLNTIAIQKAIDDCKENQCVYVPEGTFLTGGLMLHSDMELRLHDNAILQGTVNKDDYLPKIKSRFEGHEGMCYRSLINTGELNNKGGYNCKNVIIRGGKILGGGEQLRVNIIDYEKQFRIQDAIEKGLPEEEVYSFDNIRVEPGRARGRAMHICNTQNIIIADTVTGNGPAWNLHFIYSDNIITCGCQVISQGISNGDGWDPDSSTNCVVFDTAFETGDDCVAIKSGKNIEGNIINRPTEHVRIFDVTASGGWGIAIGSEMAGGVGDVKIWNAHLKGTWSGVNVKAPAERGGFVRDIEVYNCIMPQVHVAQRYRGNHGDKPAPHPPVLENFIFEDLILSGVATFFGKTELEPALSFIGGEEEEYKIRNVKIKNVTLPGRTLAPYQDFIFDSVKNVSIENISVPCKKVDSH